MNAPSDLSQLSPDQLRHLAASLMSQVEQQGQALAQSQKTLHHTEQVNQKLAYELALLKRHAFGKRSEQLNVLQISLLDEVVDADIAAIETELEDLATPDTPPATKKTPKRAPLPPELPRTEIHHDPESELCNCGCQRRRIGEEVSEKLDYTPGVFHVERHIRSKWVCDQCETLVQAPMPAQIIDKGIPTAGLLAQVLIAKYADHLPLYRQEQIFGRAGVPIPRSTLAEWVGICGVRLQPLIDALRDLLLNEPVLHADETPVPMLAPGKKKTHRAYLWAYATTPYAELKAVVYDFSEGRGGQHARDFLGDWRGKLICDDYSGYKQSFAKGVTEIGCMAHARRKFVDLHVADKSQIAGQAIALIGQLYQVEREAQSLTVEERQRLRETRARPITDALYRWMLAHREKVPNGSATAKALDYSLRRWGALTRYLDDGGLPIDNNRVENLIRPWALGRSNWLFAGSLRSGQRAANIMSLIQSAKLNGHDPYAYLRDVLERLPTHKASQLHELLPQNWQKPA
ncbi:IS66 family transposase [Halomonas sp. SH5A2]|uniref:IS66 family transposase n=1 Tax=Halomonas sp. SH5A2 TaxID=2749040 RepID=UPI00163ED31F|nr:IS66 family transposase [Halomonas sp. SH5A2]QNI04715.1 IS66 family transposase [Halomonas sp. SH5A2]QNI04769.1 IS66 family transposase [Halomonas sp. SH5A2]QNI04810.1 IS66 family transposase [Halomonas sp. SH5A2]QNI04847.1 IS66 family transposase [Halomonas sp. SH5A2]